MSKRKIEISAGYHEWLIVVNDKLVYSFQADVCNILEDKLKDKRNFDILANDIVYFMQNDFKNYDNGDTEYLNDCVKENPNFTKEELEELKKT